MRVFARIRFFLAGIACLLLCACAGKDVPPVYQGPPCQDVLSLPQDLAIYAADAGGSAPLVSQSAQTAAAGRQRDRFYRPWRLQKPSAWVQEALGKDFSLRREVGFLAVRRPYSEGQWAALVENSNKEAFGREAGPAISVRHSNLRALPTALPYYLSPELPGEGYPFDYFQHSSISPGTPLYICNISRDRQWVLAESAATAGWLPARDVARTDAAFMSYWQSRPLAALVRDNVFLNGHRAHIGTLLPMPAGSPSMLLLPLGGPAGGLSGPREHGEQGEQDKKASVHLVSVAPGDAVAVPMPLSADNIAAVGNRMLGQPYGWGGLDEKRDCSALTRDLLAPFGIYLPRNSGSQAGVGRRVDLTGLALEAKEAAIRQEAAPFRSLVCLKGHIGLYLGVYQGRTLMFHNMWGLGIKDPDIGCKGRAIVGKAVVTTLRPGVERPDLCTPGSYLERIERIAVLLDSDAPKAQAPKGGKKRKARAKTGTGL
ncbi:SH3 domain-containing protein [Desulfovibrio sp. OttesenSCG-928-A18]|nr:SH3 domain-containing protein [Desulfovibrio sp. OttesenSCG-928-A18]